FRIVIGFFSNVLSLDEPERAQHPMLDIVIGWDLAGEVGQLRGLFKCETDPRGAPLLGEKFLAIVLDQLQGRIAQNQIFPCQSNEQWAAGLRLCFPRFPYPLRINIYQSDRRFSAISFAVAGRDQHYLTLTSIKIDTVSGAGRTQGAGQVFLANHPQCTAEGKEWGLAGKIDIPT